MSYNRIIVIFFGLFLLNLNASECTKAYNSVSSEAKDYLRIDSHIREYNASCNIVYAYSIFLHNSIEMEELEKDNTYAEHLGEFVKNYPYTSKFIISRKTFEFFDRYNSSKKEITNNSIRVVFKKKDDQTKKNLQYILLALDVSGDGLKKDEFIRRLKHLKQRYNLEKMDTITVFWAAYKKKYKVRSTETIYEFEEFEKVINAYSVRTLQKYLPYAVEFYPVLLPGHQNDLTYIKTIKSLLREVKRKGTTLSQQAYFLKNISIEVQVALADGNTPKDIVSYFKIFIKQRFVLLFGELSCIEKEGMSILIADNLDAKLDWMKENKNFFYRFIQILNKEKDIDKLANTIGLYNYAAGTYAQMKTKDQKEMFEDVIKLPTGNILFNLSLLYALGENTAYFSKIINNPDFMYEGKKYKRIFYERRNGNSILSLFKKGDKSFYAFKDQVNDLVNTPYDKISDLTTEEKIDIALDVVDYASYATMIVPGVGIMAQLGKAIAKNGVKAAVNIAFQEAKVSTLSSLRGAKNKMLNVWENRTYYFKMDNLPEDEIVKLSKMSDTFKGTKEVKKYIGQLNLTPKAQEDTFLRIAMHQKKINTAEAQQIFKNLSGTDGFSSALNKVIGNSKEVTKGHLNELHIANNAAENGYEVVAIGKKFNDGIKAADTDIDVMLRINGQDVLIEAKSYASTTRFPLDKYRKDLDTLNIYAKQESKGEALKIFSFTEKPKSDNLLKQYELWAKKKGVRLIFGTPDQQIAQIAYYTKSSKIISRLDAALMGTLIGHQIYKYWNIPEQKYLCRERE